MATQDNNLIGERGERVLFLKLTTPVPPGGSLFKPVSLGDKWPTADFYVELITDANPRPFFFVQAKATTTGYWQNPRRLRVRLARKHEERLLRLQVPTYLVGIDETNDRAYIGSDHMRSPNAISSLRAAYPLTVKNLRRLYAEILGFWQANMVKPQQSIFQL